MPRALPRTAAVDETAARASGPRRPLAGALLRPPLARPPLARPPLARPRRALAPLLLAASLFGCKSPTPSPTDQGEAAGEAKAPARAPRGPETVPALRSGVHEPEAGRELLASIGAQRLDRGGAYVELRMPLRGEESSVDWDRLHVEWGDGSERPGWVAAITTSAGNEEVRLLLRVERAKAPALEGGAIYGLRWLDGDRRWVRHPFKIDAEVKASDDPELPRRFVDAVAGALTENLYLTRGALQPHPWDHFAAGRLRALIERPGAAQRGDAARPPARTELSRLMDTTTGMLSIQEALQHDRGLRIRADEGARTIDVGELKGPPLDDHPFAAMQAELPNPGAAAPEPLAAAVPVDFWYARARSLPLMLRLLDEADTWITPAVQVFQSSPEDRRLTARYETHLGLRRGELARILGGVVVGEVAIVGSDPYIREGTDITLIFAVKTWEPYDAELDRYIVGFRNNLEATGGSLVTTTREYQGVTIAVSHSHDGTIRQQRAKVGELGLVSNSPRAIERVIDAIAGRAPRLADSPDFKYMRARDPAPRDFYAFLSDRLIQAAVGPTQKIQAARREIALAELLTPGYAALLYGWIHGRSPASLKELTDGGLLDPAELRHRGGEPIDFTPPALAPNRVPPPRVTRSLYGSPDDLTPLIDLPPVTKVSEAERWAYDQFSSSYQSYWKQFIDPVSVGLDLGEDDKITVDVRILPLISATDYRDLARSVGDTRVKVIAHAGGLQAVWGVGRESPIRRDLDGILRSSTGKSDIGIGWLGDWVSVGVEDWSGLAEIAWAIDDRVQLPLEKKERDFFKDAELWRRIGKTPVWAGAAIDNPAALVATLGGIRTMVNEVAPGTVEWGEVARYRELPIVRAGIRRDAPLLQSPEIADAVALHYVQTGNAIYLALNQETLEAVIDRLLAGEHPKGDPESPAQFVLDARSRVDMPLWTVLHWLLQGQVLEASRSSEQAAEILLRGAPEGRGPAVVAHLGLSYFGAIPLSARGSPEFLLTSTGASDPAFGTEIRRTYPALPLMLSPVDRLMERMEGARIEVAFDKEPGAAGTDARSLKTHLELVRGRGR
ncbi:MAG: hypothetical protein R3B09_01405 [Nannocystaceae bacterium]